MAETGATGRQRTYDVVIYGATGYTGRIACEYFLDRYPSGVKWAMAGRSRDRLKQLQQELGSRADSIPLVVADALDTNAMDALAASTAVVANFAGSPFMDKALPLVGACCRHGTHYVDITGEAALQRASYDMYHKEAAASRALIVHNSGYDSIPSDLGAFMAASAMRERHQMGCSRIVLCTGNASGGFSGGTIHSILAMLFGGAEVEKIPGVKEVKADSVYSLDPEGGRRGPDTRCGKWPAFGYDSLHGKWYIPNIMAFINAPVVRKSNALLGYQYGESCSYAEVMGVPGCFAAICAVGVFGIAGALLVFPPTRWALTRWVLPSPGQGPSRKSRDAGFFEVFVRAEGERPAQGQEKPPVVGVRIHSGDAGDPGYKATARMCMESALCLALERSRCAANGGVLTPATALGQTLVERLKKSGMVLEVES